MMRISEAVLETKIHWFDPHMKGEFIQSDEITDRHLKKKLKHILYTDAEKEEISEEAQKFFLSSDDDLETLKTKVAKYGHQLNAVLLMAIASYML